MTTLAQRIKETPLAPYTGLLDGLTREQKMIVVTYITESMEEPATKAKSNAEIIREKLNRLTISPEIARLRGCMKLTESEKQDKTETGWADRFVGSWKDSRSAEEIVDDIRCARTANTIDVEL